MERFESLVTVSYEHHIAIVVVSCIIYDMMREISRKSHFFHPPPLFYAPIGGPHQNIRQRLVWKTRIAWLPTGKKSLMIFLAVSTQYANVTDSQTNTTLGRVYV